MQPFPEDVIGPGMGEESLPAYGGEDNNSEEHGQRVDPEQFIAESGPRENSRSGRPGTERDGALEPAGAGQPPVSPPAADQAGPAVHLLDVDALGLQRLGIALLDKGKSPSQVLPFISAQHVFYTPVLSSPIKACQVPAASTASKAKKGRLGKS